MKDKDIFNWKRIDTYTAADYRFYLNQIASVAKRKEKMTIDDKLAVALLFDLDYHARYQNYVLFMQAMAVLDTYAVISNDKGDLFGRTKMDISAIPTSTKKFFIKLYKEEIRGIHTTYQKLQKLVDSDQATLPVFNGYDLSEVEGEKEEPGGVLVEGYDYEDVDDGYEDE